MTYSEPFRQHLDTRGNSYFRLRRIEISVTVLASPPSHPRSRRAQSPRLASTGQSNQHLHSVAATRNAGRRVETGAGATPVFVAVIRHDTSLARQVSLVGRSRTCPDLSMANRKAIRGPVNSISKE
jgi:hypothetical protein